MEMGKGSKRKVSENLCTHTHTHSHTLILTFTLIHTDTFYNSGPEENRKYHLTMIFLLQPEREPSTFLKKVKVNVFGNCLTQGPNGRWISHYFISPSGTETSDLLI